MAVIPASAIALVHSALAARCRYVKSTWSRRIRWYSGSIGSLTFSTRSEVAHTSSAVAAIRAPAATYSWSGKEEPAPASCSITTECPRLTSSTTPAGVIATRYSWFLISFGTPTSIVAAYSRYRSAASDNVLSRVRTIRAGAAAHRQPAARRGDHRAQRPLRVGAARHRRV